MVCASEIVAMINTEIRMLAKITVSFVFMISPIRAIAKEDPGKAAPSGRERYAVFQVIRRSSAG
jgi:hypothetical protein